jgi:hypothetical protein
MSQLNPNEGARAEWPPIALDELFIENAFASLV